MAAPIDFTERFSLTASSTSVRLASEDQVTLTYNCKRVHKLKLALAS